MIKRGIICNIKGTRKHRTRINTIYRESENQYQTYPDIQTDIVTYGQTQARKKQSK